MTDRQQRLPIPDDLAKAVRDLRSAVNVLTRDYMDVQRAADAAGRQAAAAATASTRASGDVERLAELVTEISTRIGELQRWTADQLEQLATAGDDEEEHPQPSWLTIADVDGARKLLNDLAEWVRTVWCWYHGSSLPGCWAWHPDVVAELLAVRAAWMAAYRSKNPTGVAEWHDRWRPNAARRITESVGDCAPARHERGEAWIRPAVPGGTRHLGNVVDWWVPTHGDTPPPGPRP